MDSAEPKKRERVSKACEFCRRRKVRCDGVQPCSSCKSNGIECVFKNNTIRKPRKKTSKKNQVVNLENVADRLTRLEEMLGKFMHKLEDFQSQSMEPLKKRPKNKSTIKTESNSCDTMCDVYRNCEEGTSEEEDVDDDDEEDEEEEEEDDDDDDDENRNQDLDKSDSREFKEGRKTTTNDPLKRTVAEVFQKKEMFFGVHSMFTFFANSNLEYMESIIGSDEPLNPIKSLPVIFKRLFKRTTMKWVDPPLLGQEEKERLLHGNFPDDDEMVLDLITNIYPNMEFLIMICPSDKIIKLFQTYYDNKNGKIKSRLKISELLLMTIVYAFCFEANDSCLFGDSPSSNSASSTMGYPDNSKLAPNMNSSKSINKHLDDLYSNMIMYYKMISVVNDGVDTVVAILAMIFYLESNFMTMEVNYHLIAVAIRIAQEIGLDKFDFYEGYTKEEIFHRKWIWYSCISMDMEMCYRHGKPPVVTDLEIMSEPQFYADLLNHPDTNLSNSFSVYLSTEITRIRCKSYHKLLRDKVLGEPISKLFFSLDELNQETFALIEKLPPMPDFVSNNETAENNTTAIDIWTGLLQLHFHLTVINRIPSLLSDFSDYTSSSYKEISLSSARTILNLSQKYRYLQKYDMVDIFTLIYPLAAFLHICTSCVYAPNDPSSIDDIKLLVEVGCKFFKNDKTNKKRNGNIFKIKDLTARVTLKALFAVMEKTVNIDYYQLTPELKEYMDETEMKYGNLIKSTTKAKPTQSVLRHLKPVTGSMGNSPTSSMENAPSSTNLSYNDIPFNVRLDPFLGELENADELSCDPILQAQIFNLPNPFFDY